MFGIAIAYFYFQLLMWKEMMRHGLGFIGCWQHCQCWLLFLWFTKETAQAEIPGANFEDDLVQMIKLMARLLVLVFVISAFCL